MKLPTLTFLTHKIGNFICVNLIAKLNVAFPTVKCRIILSELIWKLNNIYQVPGI